MRLLFCCQFYSFRTILNVRNWAKEKSTRPRNWKQVNSYFRLYIFLIVYNLYYKEEKYKYMYGSAFFREYIFKIFTVWLISSAIQLLLWFNRSGTLLYTFYFLVRQYLLKKPRFISYWSLERDRGKTFWKWKIICVRINAISRFDYYSLRFKLTEVIHFNCQIWK